jgi:hypothetical protein
VEWTLEDVEELAAARSVPALYFEQRVRLPAGTFTRLADAGLQIEGSLTLRDTALTADDLAAIGRLPGMYGLRLEGCPIGDAEIAAFMANNPAPMKELNLIRTGITDASLDAIAAGLPSLEHLHLSRTAVTDAGMPALARLPRLTALELERTTVTDIGIASLGPSARYIKVNTKNTAITEVGEDAYFRAWFTAQRNPNSRTPEAVDLDACQAHLTEFFGAMNEWELDAETQYRQNPNARPLTDIDRETQAAFAAICARFCTPKLQGRGRYHRQNPPTYSRIQFFAEEQTSRNRIHILAKERFGGQRPIFYDVTILRWYLFVMLRTPEGWRLDARKWMDKGGWTNTSL